MSILNVIKGEGSLTFTSRVVFKNSVYSILKISKIAPHHQEVHTRIVEVATFLMTITRIHYFEHIASKLSENAPTKEYHENIFIERIFSWYLNLLSKTSVQQYRANETHSFLEKKLGQQVKNCLRTICSKSVQLHYKNKVKGK